MISRIWLAAGLVILLTLPAVPCSDATGTDESGAIPAGRDDTPWYDVGWKCRAPLKIDNTNNSATLTDYQVWLDIPYDKDMKSDFSDLRFVQYVGAKNVVLPFWLETREAKKQVRAYINVSSVAARTLTTVHMYFGNPAAENASDGSSTFLFIDEFEDGIIDPTKWSPLHACDSAVTVAETGGKLDFAVSSSGQWTGGNIISTFTLPKESYVVETKLKFTDYYQSAYGAYAGFTNDTVFVDDNYGNPLDLVSARLWDYTKNGWYLALSADDIGAVIYGNTQVTIRNIWYRMKTYYSPDTYAKGVWNQLDPPYANHSLEMTGKGGIDPNYLIIGIGEYNTNEHTYFDHILLRKYASPEPEVSIGAKERPYSFKSFAAAPDAVSEGANVVLTAVINNPIDLSMQVNVTFREGDEYADSNVLSTSPEGLWPHSLNNITFEWTAVGGNHTFWFELEGTLMASAGVEVNWDPKLDYIPSQLLMQAIPFTLHLTTRDADNDPLVWSLDTQLFHFSKSDNKGADISFVPSNDDVGLHRVNFTVTDPHNCSASRLVNFTVSNSNDNPVLDPISDMTIVEGSTLRFKANASDPDQKWGDTLTFSDDTTMFEIDRIGGNFTFVPSNEQVGKYAVEITVSDNQSASATRRFSLTVLNFNDPPSIDPIAPQKAQQDKLWQVMVTAKDPDLGNIAGDKLKFQDDSPLFDINPTSGLISFKPANKDVGVRSCNITVTDLAGATGTAELQLTVMNVNDPPALDAVADQVAQEDQPFELTLKATDIDVPLRLDNLTFTDDSPLFEMDAKTGRLGFTPTNAQVGRHTIKVRVTDEKGEFASRTFMLTVQNVNDPPVNVSITSLSSGQKFKEGEIIWFNATAGDIDAGDRLTFTWLEGGMEFGTGKSYSGTLSPGKHLITLEVSDGNASVTAEVEITVAKKEIPVTVAGGGAFPWMLLVAAIMVIAAVAAVVVLAKRRKKGPAAMPPEAEAPVAPAVPVPPVAEAKAPPKDAGQEEEAKKAVSAAEDALADLIADGKDTTDVELDLDLARDAMTEGDFAGAIQFANLARAGPEKAKPVKKKKKAEADIGQLKCPGCDEELQPEWPTCPVCGYKTRGE